MEGTPVACNRIVTSLSHEEWRESREIAEKLKRLVIPKIEPLPAEE